MTTIEVNIIADDDQEFVINILNALAQKQIIEYGLIDSFPADGPLVTADNLVDRPEKAEKGNSYSLDEAQQKLAKEYSAAAIENRTLMADFKYVDLEEWDDDY